MCTDVLSTKVEGAILIYTVKGKLRDKERDGACASSSGKFYATRARLGLPPRLRFCHVVDHVKISSLILFVEISRRRL